jgi:uncharacterized protein (DUF362 family)
VLKLGAGAVLGLGGPRLLAACGGHTGTTAEAPPTPAPTPAACAARSGGITARVAAARGTDLGEMTRAALSSLGGMGTVVHEGETVFVKPNMVTLPWASRSYNPFRLGECTKPEIVIAVVEECLRAGAREVTVGDGSQMPRFDWGGAVTLDGARDLATELARLGAESRRPVRLACLDADTTEWTLVPTGTSLGSVAVSSLVLTADRVISVPVAKTHRWAYLTLSLKNFVGTTPLARYGWTGQETTRVRLHSNDPSPRGFGRLLVDLARAAAPDLAVIDFSIGMEGNGPSTSTGGVPVDVRDRLGSWLLLASRDATAADATAARVMGREAPFVTEILAMAHEAGMGEICEGAIEVVGARLADLRVPWRAATPAN